MFFNTYNKRKQLIKKQDENYRKFKEQMQDDPPFEKGDYLAMLLGALWALWPVLAVVIAVIIGVSLFFV